MQTCQTMLGAKANLIVKMTWTRSQSEWIMTKQICLLPMMI